ncbi:MAG TPA: outer membrane protein transport protein [Methylibium sp.]|nr:outer membrane protein transport protein [Methylibium sp.]
MTDSPAAAACRAAVLGGLLAALAADPAGANNGLNLIGFGTESVGMGGADLAVARDTTALNTNPAGIARLRAPALDVFVEAANSRQRHADAFGNDTGVTNEFIGLGGFGWTLPLAGTPLVAGIGLFGQGGAGFVYRDLATAFGTRDNAALVFGIGRLTPALAWRASETLSFGVALPLTLARAKQEFFPRTSRAGAGPADSFFGLDITGLQARRLSLRLGALYEPRPGWTLGLAYGTKTPLPLRSGQLEADLSALGLGRVRYGRVRFDGFALPEELGLGLAWQATPALLLSVELTRLAWSTALRRATLHASDPATPDAPPMLQLTQPLAWRDQTVTALGLAWDVDARWRVYAGLNHAANPVPAETTSPMLAPIGEWHATGGLRWKPAPGWEWSATLEYLKPKTVRYTNALLPFGPDARATSAYLAGHLMLGRRW